MAEQIEDFSLVWYHGSEKDDHGFGTVRHYTSVSAPETYIFTPLSEESSIYNVRRDEFTLIPKPQIPLTPGLYRSTSHKFTDYYALTPDGRWLWICFDAKTQGTPAAKFATVPACGLANLEKWED